MSQERSLGHAVYNDGVSGELAGSATAAQMPDIACSIVYLAPASDNVGSVYVGWSSGVTKKDGTTDTTTGIEISKTSQGKQFFVPNMNKLWYICDNAGDDLTYFVHR